MPSICPDDTLKVGQRMVLIPLRKNGTTNDKLTSLHPIPKARSHAFDKTSFKYLLVLFYLFTIYFLPSPTCIYIYVSPVTIPQASEHHKHLHISLDD